VYEVLVILSRVYWFVCNVVCGFTGKIQSSSHLMRTSEESN